MSMRSKTICRRMGCNTLVATPGYCSEHHKERGSFKQLDEAKDPRTEKFYHGYRWRVTSENFREMPEHALCEECHEKGLIIAVQMVHHEPELTELWKRGLNPYDHKYLHSLCNNCHLAELRGKKK